ncbi:Di-sulfide bridge nucleocytoplasmic transport domain-containing protein [Irpex rosettiformis]|uniref:Di-sulfide bridge nucleocytoplasmic transport domain-containing protein n=1 Tax=Irpex rosettiformis TaxID=378272 RepID=A0ACB8U6H1_9APHY|nr:Di-sulfide bridge nucleocytoplasmic transport domain-containing protein [Irpex rosettiformis]
MHNVPFIINVPAPQTPSTPAWNPHELKDIDMAEASPPQPHTKEHDENEKEDAESGRRKIATGGMVRVFRSRQKQRARNCLATTKMQVGGEASEPESEEEEEGRVTPITQNTSNHYTLNLPGPAAPQSDTPYVLLGYLQFFFNSSLVLLFLYLLVQFILTVQRDVEHRISEYSMDIVQEIAQCTMHFKDNRCEHPLPAMIHQCGIWDTCMNRDPTKVGRAKVGAELIAEVINGFVEPISWKTLIFTISSLSFLTVFVNSLLSLYRSRHSPANPQTHPPIQPFPIHPIAPYQQHMLAGQQDWGKSLAGGHEIEELPSRRRKLENGSAKEVK